MSYGRFVLFIAAAALANDIAWWANTSSGWTKHLVKDGFMGASAVHAADIDIVGAAYDDGRLVWWENGNNWAAPPGPRARRPWGAPGTTTWSTSRSAAPSTRSRSGPWIRV